MPEKTGGIPRENTLTARLVGLLRDRGFPTADFEQHFPILRGRPRKPDAAFAHQGTHLLSAKFGNALENEAVSSAEEYQELIGETTVLGEVFAVAYPRAKKERFILWTLKNAKHGKMSWGLGTLEQVADKITLVARGRFDEASRGTEPVEASATRVLSQAVHEISSALVGVSDDRLKAVFGGKDFFDSVLSYALDEEDQREALRTAAGYLLVNQTFFYQLLSHELPDKYPPIPLTDASDPAVLRTKYFDRVLAQDYRPVFEVDVSSCLEGEAGSNGALKVVSAVKAIVPSLTGKRDIIGNVFHELIPLSFRKPLGAYFTSVPAAELLARLAVEAADSTVIDPACGSGTLLVAAYRRKRELNAGRIPEAELHRTFVERDLTGIDVMAFVAHLAAVHLALQEPLEDTNQVRIGVEDSTTKKPGESIDATTKVIRDGFRQRKLSAFDENGALPLAASEYTTTGGVSLGEERAAPFTLAQVDLVITNPPFTSCNNMAMRYRRAIESRFVSDKRFAKCLKGRWSLQIPFLLLANEFLRPGGRLAAVLPFTTFSGKYFEPLVDFLVQNYSIRYIVSGMHGCAFSDDTQLTEVLFVADRLPPPEDTKLFLIGLRRPPHAWTADDQRRMWRMADDLCLNVVPAPNDLFTIHPIDQKELLYRNSKLPRLTANLAHGFATASRKLDRVLESRAIGTASVVLHRNEWQLYIGKAFRVFKDSPDETGHGIGAYGGAAILYSSSRERALKKHDRLVVVRRSPKTIEVEDVQAPGKRFALPASEVVGYVRRFVGLNQLNAGSLVDTAVRRYSRHLDPILEYLYPADAESKKRTLKRDWEQKAKADQSRLLLSYKGDLVTPGTQLLACWVSNPVFVAGDVYGLRGTSAHDEKILALWFNGTPFLLSLLANRTMTRGSYGRLDRKTIDRLPLLDTRMLSSRQREKLLKLFEDLQLVEWPSLINQFRREFPPRIELDRHLLEALDVPETDIEMLGGLFREGVLERLEGLMGSTHKREERNLE
ncbi:MAG TPA: N-6 DNA methylase [Thermoplasmata archaeon]|nr:N-6 DNA methylase [Thermoplasmata archaeon]